VTDIRPYIDRIAARFKEAAAQNPDLPARTIQFTFTDSGEAWYLSLGGGDASEPVQGTAEKPDVSVTAATDVMAGIMDKNINGAMAYMQRKVQVKGAMDDLLRLQKLIM
jgi:putative sterol carrier protein